jgi:hypothetical protein
MDEHGAALTHTQPTNVVLLAYPPSCILCILCYITPHAATLFAYDRPRTPSHESRVAVCACTYTSKDIRKGCFRVCCILHHPTSGNALAYA